MPSDKEIQTPDSSPGATAKSENKSLVPILVTPGEFYDRLTIAEIKVTRCSPDKTQAAIRQRDALNNLAGAQKLLFTVGTLMPLKNLVEQLMRTNEELWTIEDKLRAMDAEIFTPCFRYADHIEEPRYGDGTTLTLRLVTYLELARSVYVTNDRRAQLKRDIDKIFDVPPEVKDYAAYGQEAQH
jgi:hypothetical protein